MEHVIEKPNPNENLLERNLLKLGASKKVAIPIAMSRKGPWNLHARWLHKSA